jgi:hypothetical protein
MGPLLSLISVARLNAILEQAGVPGERHVQDVTIISDRQTLMSRISRLRLTYLVSPGFRPDLGSRGETEGLHSIGVLSFDDEFREAVA